MSDQDPFDILPELEIVEEIGDVMFSENGMIALSTDIDLLKVKEIIKKLKLKIL